MIQKNPLVQLQHWLHEEQQQGAFASYLERG